jgi:hypothetical protein
MGSDVGVGVEDCASGVVYIGASINGPRTTKVRTRAVHARGICPAKPAASAWKYRTCRNLGENFQNVTRRARWVTAECALWWSFGPVDAQTRAKG